MAVTDLLEQQDAAIDRLAEAGVLLAEGIKSAAELIGEKGSQIEALTDRLAKSESDFAELLAKLAEIEARIPAA